MSSIFLGAMVKKIKLYFMVTMAASGLIHTGLQAENNEKSLQSANTDSTTKTNAEIQQLEARLIEARSLYLNLYEQAAGYAIQAEAVRIFNRDEYRRLMDLSEKKYEEAKRTLKDIDQILTKRSDLINQQVKVLDQVLRSLRNDEAKLQDDIRLNTMKANEISNPNSDDYLKLKQQNDEKNDELDSLRLKIKNLHLQRKLLLMQDGHPENESESPYQSP